MKRTGTTQIGVLLGILVVIVFVLFVPVVEHHPARYEYGECWEVVSEECRAWSQSQTKRISIAHHLSIYFSSEAKADREFEYALDTAPEGPNLELGDMVLPDGQNMLEFLCEKDRAWLEQQDPKSAAKCPQK